jgi:hypothetical protein
MTQRRQVAREFKRSTGVAVAGLVAALALVALPAGASADVSAPIFGSPQLIATAAPYQTLWTSATVACGSATHCTASGTIAGSTTQVTTTDDAGSASAPHWSKPSNAGLGAFRIMRLACPTATLCVAVGSDASGNGAVVSTDGGTTWSAPTTFEPTSDVNTMDALGCTTSDLCVALDQNGNAFYRSVAGTWSGADPLATRVSPAPSLGTASVACFGTGSCVISALVGNDFALVASSDISAASPTWTVTTTADQGTTAGPIGCSANGTCLAVDGASSAFASSTPTAATPNWTRTATGDASLLRTVSCPSDDACVLTDIGGNSLIAKNVASGTPAFTSVFVGSSGAAAPLVCPSTSWCVGANANNVFYAHLDTSTPANTTWTKAQVYGTDRLTALGCSTSGGICAAVDGKGRPTTSADGGATWSAPATITGVTSVAAVSCVTDGTCVLLNTTGAYVATGIGTQGASAWSGGAITGETGNLTGLSCPTSALCVAIDSLGNAVVSTDPQSGPSTWTIAATGATTSLTAISCPTATLCAAGDASGNVWYSTAPASGSWSAPAAVDSGQQITALSCLASGLCVAGDNLGNVLDSTHVTQGQASWSATVPSGSTSKILRLACTTAGDGVCSGVAGSSTSNGGSAVFGPSIVGSGTWSVVSGAPTNLTSVACTSDLDCVWTDAAGEAIPGPLGTAAISLSHDGLSFPDTVVAAVSASQTVTVSNPGTSTLNVSDVALAGSGAGSFAIKHDSCSEAALAPGDTCTVDVAFAPAAAGALTATLQIPSDAPSGADAVTLTGTGTSPSTGGSGGAGAGPAAGGSTPAGGGSTPTGGGGGTAPPAVTAGKPAVAARLSGATTRRPKLTLTATAGAHAPALRKIRVTLPKGLSFVGSAKTLTRRITVKAGTKKVKATITGRGQTITITIKAASKVVLTLPSSAVTETKTLQVELKGHKIKQLKVSLRLTDAAGKATSQSENLVAGS